MLFKNMTLCFTSKIKPLSVWPSGGDATCFSSQDNWAFSRCYCCGHFCKACADWMPRRDWGCAEVNSGSHQPGRCAVCSPGRSQGHHCCFGPCMQAGHSLLAWLQDQLTLSCGYRKELIVSFVLASWNAEELINCGLKVLSSPET